MGLAFPEDECRRIADVPAWLMPRRDHCGFARELLSTARELHLSVAAWPSLESGVLSGTYTRGDSDAAIPERHRAVARRVDSVADDLGLTSAQVAIAWIRAHRRRIHPVLGARSLPQLADNLAGLDVELPVRHLQSLDEVSAIQAGFPHDFLEAMREVVHGPSGRGVDGRAD